MSTEEFGRRTDPYRRELLAHCYRMLGSVQDAEDQVQETLLRAWRAFARYDESRASLRTWLYRIATNTCLTALEQGSRRPLPSGLGAPSEDPQAPLRPALDIQWLQPIPDDRLDPAAAVTAKGSLRLALVAAMQLLPPKQRAVLILREVLDWSAAEIAEALETSTASVNSALQRARATVGRVAPDEDELTEPGDAKAVLDSYMAAFEAADVQALAKLLTDDAAMEMPPVPLWYAGRDDYAAFLARVFAMRGKQWRTVATAANGQPAFAAYSFDGTAYRAHSIQVLTITGGRISRNVVFYGQGLFGTFGLPAALP